MRAAQSLSHSFIHWTHQLRVYSEPATVPRNHSNKQGGVASALTELTVCRGGLTSLIILESRRKEVNRYLRD